MGGPTESDETKAIPRAPEAVGTSTLPSATRSSSHDHVRPAASPTKIGRYEVERLLGQGGMGRVWLARDTVLGRKVAIKVLRDDLALPPPVHDELVVRMVHEARAAAAVSHPNIVTLHDMGEDEGVGLFLVFEYVTTKSDDDERADVVLSLRDRLKRGPLSFSEVAKLARELGSALTFAHEAGVIHRDVKPENILSSRNGFKIADFGIARIPDSTITRTDMVLGTPAYTAPEALSKGEFGPASDQFSLAATLYEAATAARAFSGEDAIVTAGKVSSEPPPPLHESIGPARAVRALDRTLQRGLSKEPEARFASCAELGQEVARAIEGDEASRRSTTTRSGSLPTPAPRLIEVERTPLSSRMASVERAINEHASVLGAIGTETPRPSIMLRKRTHRVQNIAAGAAIVVIAALVVFGKRAPSGDATTSASASARPAIVAPTPSAAARAPTPRPAVKPKPAPEPHPTPTVVDVPPDERSSDAGAAPDEHVENDE